MSEPKNNNTRKPFNWPRLGVWVWGSLLAILSVGVVCVILLGNPNNPNGLYCRISGAESLVGAVIAVTGVAWSWFYQLYRKDTEDQETKEKIEKILELLEKGNVKTSKADPQGA